VVNFCLEINCDDAGVGYDEYLDASSICNFNSNDHYLHKFRDLVM